MEGTDTTNSKPVEYDTPTYVHIRPSILQVDISLSGCSNPNIFGQNAPNNWKVVHELEQK